MNLESTISAGAPDARQWWRRWGGAATGMVLAGALGALLWYALSDTAATRREVAVPPMLMLPPPPPPPPEPEKLPEPTPEKAVPEVAEPQPSPVERPAEDSPPSPQQEAGDPVTMDGAAQAGSDAFGIQAGRGGGMTGGGGGGGLGGATYGRYVANALQQAFARDPRTRQLAFNELRVDLWLDADGKTARVQLVQGTGNAQTDELVLAMVRDFRADERPPASLRFPARTSIKGRRP
ncbi:TonB C-terminal domain-containing protein [Janthinobacterium fluminis]|uniref:TonB C-terminal domain-containing protein n=1 Tax=Janthinobacterium fluminis TaxID=2987524 RepID=A0ABT5K0J3_9BURK|nr:TonB C-terminal domain-containing protein [Janthinobacterium fluminis]MDC8757975.1 TonB C-terminal domain-containing protein [Janthinobacterium fluminis]